MHAIFPGCGLRTRLLCTTLLLAGGYSQTTQAELLGVSPQSPLINFSGTGLTTYHADTGLFGVKSAPVALVFPPVKFIGDASGAPENFEINIEVDTSGHLVGGVPGDDLVIVGAVNLTGNAVPDADGVLLTGEISRFGYRETGTSTDLYDFVFTVTGGELAHLYAGQELAVTMNSEASSFTGNFAVDFSGKAKGTLGATAPQPKPSIEICTLVTLNPDLTSNFSDADNISGDSCDSFTQSIPSGVVGEVDGTYKLKVTNIGNETLVDVVINAPEFGLINEPIPAACGSLEPSESCVIAVDDPNTAYEKLVVANICQEPGMVSKQASTTGTGIVSGIAVNDNDPAMVQCVTEPHITLVKKVSLNGGAFLDANTPAAGPSAALGADAIYRLIVTNDGTESLTGVVINDPSLGIANVALGVDPFLPGASVVITEARAGFGLLYAPGRCDSIGEHLNIAYVNAAGKVSGTPVSSEDPAYITCADPQIKILKQVSIDGVNFFEADLASDIDVPVGIAGQTDATYRLIVKNIGSEPLTNVVVKDDKLGIDQSIADLAVGEQRMLTAGDLGFADLYQPRVCNGETGNHSNVANVNATGVISAASVTDSNPANVKCITGPQIEILKQVKLAGGEFVDADTVAAGPMGLLGDDVIYRFIVKNIGDEALTKVSVTDMELGINAAIVKDLAVGEQVVLKSGDAGFENLYAAGYCDVSGSKLNIAKVKAHGALTNKLAKDDDPAYVSCAAPVQCAVSVDQTCVVKPKAGNDKLCTNSISATTLRYTGPNMNGATVTFAGKDGGSVTYTGVDLQSNVTILTKAGQNGYTVDAGVGAKLGSATTITINGKQEIIHTSCSAIYSAGQPAPLDSKTPNPANSAKGDPSPNWSVVTFRQKDDIVISEPATNADGAQSCNLPHGGGEVTYAYKVKNDGTTLVDITSIVDSKFGQLLASSPKKLEPGQVLEFTKGPVSVTAAAENTVNVLANVTGNNAVLCPAMDSVAVSVDPAPKLSCADGKPAKLGITYVGGSCSDSKHSQGSSKSSCSGTSKGVSPVKIDLMDKSGNSYLSQVVNIGDTVILDAGALGKSKFDSETNVSIFNGGKEIQTINFHTSCSAPLLVGDQHGGIVITSFTPEGGSGSGKGSKGSKGSKGKDAKGSKGKDAKGSKAKGSKSKKGSKGKK